MLIKAEVKTYIVDWSCDTCQIGKMRPTGRALLTYPVQYPHICDNPGCGATDKFYTKYPATIHE